MRWLWSEGSACKWSLLSLLDQKTFFLIEGVELFRRFSSFDLNLTFFLGTIVLTAYSEHARSTQCANSQVMFFSFFFCMGVGWSGNILKVKINKAAMGEYIFHRPALDRSGCAILAPRVILEMCFQLCMKASEDHDEYLSHSKVPRLSDHRQCRHLCQRMHQVLREVVSLMWVKAVKNMKLYCCVHSVSTTVLRGLFLGMPSLSGVTRGSTNVC